ncbi:YeeE/YedE family protein [Vibrio renipiscarius]|uniref:YeeE/YedE family protein n=1 Tax=Vibrio renipiscarius TaxID=1461322 RepID=UPI00354DB83C
MDQLIPWSSLFGGMLLGVAAVLLLLFTGKIAGISGIINGVVMPKAGETLWRVIFLAGMMIGGLVAITYLGIDNPADSLTINSTNLWVYAIAGLLVGLGAYLGNGCTSGHGICGIGRLSKRSIVATVIFMAIAGITVFIRLHIL